MSIMYCCSVMYCFTSRLQHYIHEAGDTIRPSMALFCTFHATLALQELRTTQSSACEKHPLTFGDFLFTEISRTRTIALPMEKIHLNTLTLFSHDPVIKKGTSAPGANARTQRISDSVRKHFCLEKVLVPPLQAAKRGLPLSALRDPAG